MHLLEVQTFNRGIYLQHDPYWIVKGGREPLGIALYTVFINKIPQLLFTFQVHLYSEWIFIKCPLFFLRDQSRDRLRPLTLTFALICNIWRLTTPL